MHHRSLKASSARPSQTPLEGRADDASCLTPNTVALPSGEGNQTKDGTFGESLFTLFPLPYGTVLLRFIPLHFMERARRLRRGEVRGRRSGG